MLNPQTFDFMVDFHNPNIKIMEKKYFEISTISHFAQKFIFAKIIINNQFSPEMNLGNQLNSTNILETVWDMPS